MICCRIELCIIGDLCTLEHSILKTPKLRKTYCLRLDTISFYPRLHLINCFFDQRDFGSFFLVEFFAKIFQFSNF